MKGITIINTRINGSTRDFVYYTLRNQIINLKLEPGTKISEKEVSEKLKVSRTPVREAFLKLSQEELLGVYPQSGTIVTLIDLSLVEEGRFIRENIEKAVVREACQVFDKNLLFQLETNVRFQELCIEKDSHHKLFELDDEFHRILFEGCGKIRTWNMIRQMNSHFDRLRMLRLVANQDWNIVVSQHKEIYNYVAKKSLDHAEQAMTSHLKLVNLEKEELKKRYPGFFE
ncbi:FCD domain-containing protein [Aquibacillus halophilus]|uniref:FCD domain-containing protein n=1 Tax=Aquibacillus halophilus TaxID=930132 RepID=A0A6A8DAY3_9BACI|nr:FCD domain-containing protein [Aquibacillus halophilus]